MKTLMDLSLECIGNNLRGNISRLATSLAPKQKELVLERLVYHDRLTPDYLPHITYNLFCSSLRRVNFYRCEQITDVVLQQLGASACRLTHLTIHECSAVTDAGVIHITKEQTELITLKLRKLTRLTAKSLTFVHSPALVKVDFRGCHFTTDAIRTLLKLNHSIKKMILADCKRLDDTVFSVIADKLGESLEVLLVRDLHFLSNASLIKIASCCPNLIRLDLHGCNRVSEEGFSQLVEKCRRLRRLDLSYCTGVQRRATQDAFSNLSLQLRELSLCGVMFEDSDALVSVVSRLVALKTARFCGVPALTDDAMSKILSSIGCNLEDLDLSGGLMSPLTDNGLSSISKYCTSLTKLGLSMLRVTGSTIVPLLQDSQRASRLIALRLSCKSLDPDVVHYIGRHCSSLEELIVSGVVSISDAQLMSIAETCTQLTDIGLKGCRLVTDVGVRSLAQYCPHIRCLVLSGIHSITDRSLFALANGCPHIDEIYLSGCNNVSRAAIRYLIDKCIPRVFYEHRVPNANPEQIVGRNLDTGLFTSPETL